MKARVPLDRGHEPGAGFASTRQERQHAGDGSRRTWAEHDGKRCRAGDRQQREGWKQRSDVDEMAREHGARDRHDEDRNDPEQAIHQHRCDRIDAADTFFRQPVRAHSVPADACGQKGTDERADEEDPHHGCQAADAGRIERRQQRPPAIGHQHAIDCDEGAREQNESPIGAARRLPHRSRIALPEQQGSQSDCDHDADALGERALQDVPRRSGSRWITAVIC